MLTDTAIRNAKPRERPYKLRAGKGLYLEVRPSGKKLWRYRYRLEGAEGAKRENMYALGEYGKLGPDRGQYTLAEAQQERARARQLVQTGKHPSHDRRERRRAVIESQANTFRTVAEEWIAANRGSWTPYYCQQIERAFAAAVYPGIGDLAIVAVTPPQLLKIVKAKAKKAPTVALLLRQWMGAVFRYAIGEHKATSDPSSAIRGTVKRKAVKSKEPLRDKDIPAFRKALSTARASRPISIAIELLLYTFVRPGEIRLASWPEFDLEGALWRIPAERMKMGEAHIVPLAPQAISLLRELRRLTGAEEWLFPNTRDPKRPMSATTLNRVLERMGYAGRFSAHGFRATASTWLNEAGFRPDVIERQLAHKERNAVRSAYNRAEYLAERRQMMSSWADTVDAMGSGKVVAIGSAARAA
jgi:integrase